jgi:hypothetical protein
MGGNNYSVETGWIQIAVWANTDSNEVPEFGAIAGGIALVGALGIFLHRRR